MVRTLFVTVALLFALGVTLADEKHAKPVAKNAAFEKLKSLAGDWVSLDKDGKPTDQVFSSFKVTAAGSAVHETIMPGSDHEMVTVYHMEGNDLVLTHYCAIGNQPKMKLDPKSTDKELKFDFAGGANINPAKDMHMHEGKFVFLDKDKIEATWVGHMDGKPGGHTMVVTMVRKKK